MRTATAAVTAQSGAVSATLIALAGFAAGALVVGLLALVRHPAPAAGESARMPASGTVLHEADPASTIMTRDTEWPSRGEPFPWPFEATTPASAVAPGRNRPDKLSAPEGWTQGP
jgi:hypothetical protein